MMIRKRLFCPNGRCVTDLVVEGCTSAMVLEGGFSDYDWELMEHPSMEAVELGGSRIMIDQDGNEFLSRHCREAEVSEHHDPEGDEEENGLSSWPDEIVMLCTRVLHLEDGLRHLADMRRALPLDFADTTTNVVLEKIVKGRIVTEIADLEKRLATFRAGRTEITRLEDWREIPSTEGEA